MRVHRRLQGHLGPRRRPRRADRDAARRSSAPPPRCSARRRVEFLGYVDGELDHELAARVRGVRASSGGRGPTSCSATIRGATGRIHPDHRHAGLLAIEGIVAARDPHFFPEQELAPHRPRALLLFEAERRGSRRARRRLARPQGRGAAAAPESVALDDGHRRSSRGAAGRVRRRDRTTSRKRHGLRAGVRARRGVPPHRRPLARGHRRERRPDAKGPGCTRVPSTIAVEPAQRFLAVRLRAVRFVARLAGRLLGRLATRCLALRGGLAALLGGLARTALRLAVVFAAFFAALRRRPCASRVPCAWRPSWPPCASRVPCAWQPSSLPCAWREPCALPCAWPEPSSPPCAWQAPSRFVCLLSRRHGHHLSRELSLKGSSNFTLFTRARGSVASTPYTARSFGRGP